MTSHQEKCEEVKAMLRERAHSSIQKSAITLAEELQNVFHGLRAEEGTNVKIEHLEEIHTKILALDKKILDFVSENHPAGEDETYVVQWLYGPQRDIFDNWSMKVGYLLDDLERRTDGFSLHVDRMLAEPWEKYGKLQWAYNDVLRRGKVIIEDYYTILKLKFYHNYSPLQGFLRPSKEIRNKTVLRIDDLARLCLERVQKGTEKMRELFFKFSDHRFAEEAANQARASAWASRLGLMTGMVTIALTAASLIIGIIQLRSPTIIQTSKEHPLEVKTMTGVKLIRNY